MKIFKPTYQTQDGETKTVENYYLRYHGRRYPLGVADKRIAETKARDLITRLELGYDPEAHEKAKREPLTALVAEFIGRLTSRAGVDHCQSHEKRLLKVIAALGAKTLSEFGSDRCEAWLRSSGLAARTRHHYTRLFKQFGAFLVASDRCPKNPYAKLPPVTGIEQDRRLSRRALTEEEIEKLLASVPLSGYRWLGLSGTARAMLYKTVLCTGLRRDEAASLVPESFRFDANPAYVVVEARHTKNRSIAHQPLSAALVAELRVFLSGLPAAVPVWAIRRKDTAHMVRMDLAEAGVEVEQGGQSLDWHALSRTTFGTRLALRGVPLALAQKLMRHSTPVLTANIYTVAQLSDLSREIEKLS